MTTKKVLQFLAFFLVVAVSVTFLLPQHRPSSANTNTTQSMPFVKGTQLVTASGQTIVLRGAQIESSFMYGNSWKHNNDVSRVLNSAIFDEMGKNWHMNAVRIPLSNWIYNWDPKAYLSLLDQVVNEANQAGLYTILNLHDDDQAGSPYGSGAGTPKPESVAFWKIFAAHYASNPMVIFDAFNEPWYPDGKTWLNGGGTITGSTGKTARIVGMQTLVNTIRAAGAKQAIVIGGVKYTLAYEKKYHVALRINDPNIVYTRHTYRQVSNGDPTTWDAQWGSLKGHYPLYYGEWALLPNSRESFRCQGATMQNADQKVINFMNYMDQNNISWTAWEFHDAHLIVDRKTFTPTRLDDPSHPWQCNSPDAIAGMGVLVKQHLLTVQ